MAVFIAREALEIASFAVYNAIEQGRDLDGIAINVPRLTDDDLIFAILGTITCLLKDEVLQAIVIPQEWPKCRQAKE